MHIAFGFLMIVKVIVYSEVFQAPMKVCPQNGARGDRCGGQPGCEDERRGAPVGWPEVNHRRVAEHNRAVREAGRGGIPTNQAVMEAIEVSAAERRWVDL